MFCEKCGKELKDDWKKCPYCGNEIFEKVENTETSAETEDMESEDFVVYELQGMRPLYSRIPVIPRIGKIITEIKLEGEDVHIVTQGLKKAECHFRKQDIQKIDLPLLPIWTFGDVMLLAGFGFWACILLLISGIYISAISSIVALLYFFNTMFLRHVRIRLNSGKTIKIPICQREEAFELLKEFQYPLSELEKNDAKQMSADELGSWVMRKWIISVVLFLTAGVGVALAVVMRGDLDSNPNEAVETDADVDSNDLEWILGETEEVLIKSGFSMEEDGSYSFLEGDVLAECEDGKVSYVMIQGSKNDTPGFHGVRVGMDVDNADTVLADKYQYTSEEEKEGKKVVAYFDAESSIGILLYSDADGVTAGSITEIYAVWYSEEKLQELYGGEYGETQEDIQEEPKEQEQTAVNTQKKEESEEQSENNKEEYIFSDSNSRYLSEEEIRSVDADKLRIARNEIFARHGYIFNDEELNQYFNSTSWYQGTVPSDQFDMDWVLNDFEKKNAELISLVEEGNRESSSQAETIHDVDVVGGYANITEIAESLIKNNESIVGQKVAFCGWGFYHDSDRIELHYFEGEDNRTLVTAYYDSEKMPTMGTVEPFDMANTIVWGTVRGISDDYGIEIDLDAVNVSDQNLWFTEYYAADYREIFSIYEGNAAEWGGKLTLEGTIQAENGHKHSLILDNGDEVTLWGGMSEELSSVGENAIYDSFDGLRVRVYGKMLSMNLTISVDYIYPIVQ